MEKLRVDKWLWAARFFKTRSMATEEVNLGRVQLDGNDIKAAREIRIGDVLKIIQGKVARTIVVQGLSDQRKGAPEAQLLYAETPESLDLRRQLAERNRLSPEPAQSITGGRPTKRDRRALKGWGDRWSASAE
jgi:ribosome-associated heat shock protein Hsp15